MTVAKNPDAETQGETPSWAWPVHAFVAWLTAMLDYITRFKRARRFKPDWRDSWEDLRHSEWLRDQLIAQGVAQLLAGQTLQLDDTRIALTPPASYSGPCPRTPFDMNRRFIALARWAADPEAIIRARFKRLSRILQAAHGSTDALRAAHHEAVWVSTRQNTGACVALMVNSDPGLDPGERPSNHEGGLTSARGPPPLPQIPTRPTPQRYRATETAPCCPPRPDQRRTDLTSIRRLAEKRDQLRAGSRFLTLRPAVSALRSGSSSTTNYTARPRATPFCSFFIFALF